MTVRPALVLPIPVVTTDRGTTFDAYFKVENENKVKGMVDKTARVKMDSALEFVKGGDEIVAYMLLKMDDYKSEINWLDVKSKDKNFKVVHQPVKEKLEILKSFETKDHKWVLTGKYLYREGKKDGKEFTEMIGRMMQHEVAKVQFFSDGSIKSYKPEKGEGKQVKWKEVKLVENYENLE